MFMTIYIYRSLQSWFIFQFPFQQQTCLSQRQLVKATVDLVRVPSLSLWEEAKWDFLPPIHFCSHPPPPSPLPSSAQPLPPSSRIPQTQSSNQLWCLRSQQHSSLPIPSTLRISFHSQCPYLPSGQEGEKGVVKLK